MHDKIKTAKYINITDITADYVDIENILRSVYGSCDDADLTLIKATLIAQAIIDCTDDEVIDEDAVSEEMQKLLLNEPDLLVNVQR